MAHWRLPVLLRTLQNARPIHGYVRRFLAGISRGFTAPHAGTRPTIWRMRILDDVDQYIAASNTDFAPFCIRASLRRCQITATCRKKAIEPFNALFTQGMGNHGNLPDPGGQRRPSTPAGGCDRRQNSPTGTPVRIIPSPKCRSRQKERRRPAGDHRELRGDTGPLVRPVGYRPRTRCQWDIIGCRGPPITPTSNRVLELSAPAFAEWDESAAGTATDGPAACDA